MDSDAILRTMYDIQRAGNLTNTQKASLILEQKQKYLEWLLGRGFNVSAALDHIKTNMEDYGIRIL